MQFSRLEQLIDSMPQRGIPTCDLAVTIDGEQVFRRAAGFSDEQKTKPVSPDDLYWIFSASKLITCTAAMQLIEQGKLSLDDPVSRYLPAFGELTVRNPDQTISPCRTPMTILHLFTMTGGMTYDLDHPAVREAAAVPGAGTLEIVSAMARMPLRFEPGTHYRYSLCHDVLGAVVEVVSGMRLSDYLKTHIFEPLGMTDTGFHPTPEQISRICASYRYDSGTGTSRLIPSDNEDQLTPRYDSGGGGLFSSVDDYMRFVSALACGGAAKNGARLLQPESIAQMEVNRLCPAALRDFVTTRLYGYGWGLCGRVHMNPVYSLSLSPVGEFGWDGAAGAFAMIDRKNRLALYFAMHVRGCSYAYHVLHPLIRNLVYEGLGLLPESPIG